MFEEEYEKKNEFVKMLSKAISKYIRNIDRIEYEAYKSTEHPEWSPEEFIIVHYVGGATQVRCTSGNSHGANYEEIGKMLYSSQVFNDRNFYNTVKTKLVKVEFKGE